MVSGSGVEPCRAELLAELEDQLSTTEESVAPGEVLGLRERGAKAVWPSAL